MSEISNITVEGILDRIKFPEDKRIFIDLVTQRKTLEVNSMDYRVMLGLSQMKTVGEIAAINKVTEESVLRVMRSKDFNDWFYDKLQLAAMESGWTHGKILKKLEDIWEGKTVPQKIQLDALRMIKDLVVDRSRRIAEEKSKQPVININLNAAQAALDRQKVIEAKVLSEPRNSQTSLPTKP